MKNFNFEEEKLFLCNNLMNKYISINRLINTSEEELLICFSKKRKDEFFTEYNNKKDMRKLQNFIYDLNNINNFDDLDRVEIIYSFDNKEYKKIKEDSVNKIYNLLKLKEEG